MTDAPFAVLPYASGQVFTGQGAYGGISIRATGGAVDIDVYDGTSAAGTLLDTIHVATGATGFTHYGPGGRAFKTGVYLSATGAGTPTGSVHIA